MQGMTGPCGEVGTSLPCMSSQTPAHELYACPALRPVASDASSTQRSSTLCAHLMQGSCKAQARACHALHELPVTSVRAIHS